MTTDNAAGLAGHEGPGAEARTATRPDPGTEDVLEALRDVVDPELGVNVVDLGLVYGVTVTEDRVATIDMTLTSAAPAH
jgi:metal-sulfur cluster biosynthetic enzyme